MNKDPKTFLLHILECIGYIEYDVHNISKEEFLDSVTIQDAVNRRLEIIGEATKNIPENIRNHYKSIPWKKLAGMRDILIHNYFGVDLDMVWGIVKDDLPDLKNKIKVILDELNKA